MWSAINAVPIASAHRSLPIRPSPFWWLRESPARRRPSPQRARFSLTAKEAVFTQAQRVQIVRISESHTHRFVGVGNVIVAVYVGAPEATALRARIPWIEQAIRTYGAVGQLVVVDRTASGSLPDRAFRDESRAQADRYRGSILFSASVIEGNAVHHALVRTFLRGLALVAGKDVAVRFFDEVAPAARWAEELARDRGGPSASMLERAVDALRPRAAPAIQAR